MPDACFADPQLAAVYDALDPDRSDLDAYLAIADELGARSVLDVGCGTGTFACLLAERDKLVTALDPAAASLAVAATKPFAHAVRWIAGTLDALGFEHEVDLVTMTGNVAQVFLDDDEWHELLCAARRALCPGGHLVFESREPQKEAWRSWTRAGSRRAAIIPGTGTVTSFVEVLEVNLPYVTFETTFCFGDEEHVRTSRSTLRFRERDELEGALVAAGFILEAVRDAPDRPGLELVMVARAE